MTSKNNILIIGGGAIGLCTAYYLSRSGASVTVVDKGEMGHGSSLHNAGYISPSHFVPLAAPGVFAQGLKWMFNSRSPLYIQPRIDFNFFSWAWKFHHACNERVMHRSMPLLRDLLVESSQLFDEMSQTDEMNFEITRKGLVMLYRTERGKYMCEYEAALAHEVDIDARLLNQDQLHELDPHIEFRAHGGVYFPGDTHLVPEAFVQNLSDYLGRAGVQLVRNCEASHFEISDKKIISIQTNRGAIHADEFILASGAWSPLLVRDLRITMYLQAGKGYSLTVKDPPIKPSLPCIFNERRVAITPFDASLRFAGTMEFAGMNTGINLPRVEAILDAVPLYFGNVKRPDVTDGDVWYGLRPVTPDGLPYIGRFSQYKNLIAATGHAMLGISLAPITGRIVSEIVTDRKPSHDLSLLQPNRYD